MLKTPQQRHDSKPTRGKQASKPTQGRPASCNKWDSAHHGDRDRDGNRDGNGNGNRNGGGVSDKSNRSAR